MLPNPPLPPPSTGTTPPGWMERPVSNLVPNNSVASRGPQKGLPGRLTRGAGTHLASWLQESTALSLEEGQSLLDSGFSVAESSGVRGKRALDGLYQKHGKKVGHTNLVSDVAYSGDILISKDSGGMRLWRAGGDFALLRCVSAKGAHVAVHESGQFIVTGTRGREIGNKYRPKIWGPAGASAFATGKKNISVARALEQKSGPAAKKRASDSSTRGSDLKDFIAKQRQQNRVEQESADETLTNASPTKKR